MLKKAVLLLIGILITVFIAGHFGFSDILQATLMANPLYIALAVAMQVATLCLIAARLVAISSKEGGLSFKKAMRVSIAGMAANLLTPVAKIGGEPLKIYMLKKDFGTSKSSAIVSIDTITEIVSSLITAAIIFLIFIKFLPAPLFVYFAVFFVVVILSLAFVFKLFTDFSWLNRTVGWITNRISKYKKVKDMDYAMAFHAAFGEMIQSRGTMSSALLLSFAIKILEFARMWLVFLALGTVLPFDVVMIIWAVLLILSMIPWLPGGLGLVEFGGISVFIMFGLQKGVAASGMLIDRIISFWFIILLGAAVFIMYKDKNKAVKSR